MERYIDFLILLIHTPLVSALFCSNIGFIFLCSSFLFQYIFVIYLILFSLSIDKNKVGYGRPTEAV